MPPFLLAYLGALVGLLALDAVWLGVVMGPVYTGALGHLLRPEPLWAAAVVFYLVYPLGVVVFGIRPSSADDGARRVAGRAALFGALAYATYDLTNLATLRDWPLHVTVVDIVWGAVLSALSALSGRWLLQRVQRR